MTDHGYTMKGDGVDVNNGGTHGTLGRICRVVLLSLPTMLYRRPNTINATGTDLISYVAYFDRKPDPESFLRLVGDDAAFVGELAIPCVFEGKSPSWKNKHFTKRARLDTILRWVHSTPLPADLQEFGMGRHADSEPTCEWLVSFQCPESDDTQSPCAVLIHLASRFLSSGVFELARRFFEYAEANAAFHAFLDIDRASETQHGSHWSLRPALPVPWRRYVELQSWRHLTPNERRIHVRGVFPAIFLGSDLAKRLDHDDEGFASRLRREFEDATVDIVEYDSGAVAVLLTAYAVHPPSAGHPPHLSVIGDPWDPSIDIAAWMHREFRRKGVL